MSLRALARRARRPLAASWPLAVLILVGLLVEAGFTAMVPLAFRALIDRVIEPRDTRLLAPILVLLAGGMVVAVAAGLLRDYAFARLSSAALRELRHRMFSHLLRTPPAGAMPDGDVVARFTTDLASVEQALVAAIPWAGLPSLEALLSVILLFTIDWRLALAAMLVFPLALAGPRVLARRATAAGYARKRDEARVIAALGESLATRPAITAFGLENRMTDRFGEGLAALVRSSTRTAFLGALVERSAGIGILTLHVVVLGAGTVMTLQGQITLGSLVSFQSLFLTLSWSLSYVAQYAPTAVLAAGAARRIEELFAAPAPADAPHALDLPPFARTIRFDDVSLRYDRERPALAHVSFEVRAGQFVAIVGGIGSGKSSLVKLLARFRDPDGGRIIIDGCDLRSLTRRSLRAQIGMVFQEALLFDGSIRENLTVGRDGVSDSEIEAAASLVGLHEQIQMLPRAYDTNLGELGHQLSGGQRQLLAVARAVLRDPPILILDEPTSSLDSRTAAIVEMTLDLVSRGRTVLVVTHRLASARRADRVLVMSQGQLVEEGTHEDLLARSGIYAGLWSRREGSELLV
ncbi:MAG: ABC transporter ATP-binding protein [Acidimicrobiia bacterium]|nr:ABC transporter ATP-binding protein [Acidimicrobiia bacterium]